jgi:hypothetical protein
MMIPNFFPYISKWYRVGRGVLDVTMQGSARKLAIIFSTGAAAITGAWRTALAVAAVEQALNKMFKGKNEV